MPPQILQQTLDLGGLADTFSTFEGDEPGTGGFGRFEHDVRSIRVSGPAKSQLPSASAALRVMPPSLTVWAAKSGATCTKRSSQKTRVSAI
ncbi:MAG: hypothetical protein MO852_07950 [Candidatus Devosia euplotis]|nr:hypothetical protein [Candidatus Devosia euplotis]